MVASDAQQERLASNEALYREINEQIAGLSELHPLPTLDVVCECADIDCTERFAVAVAEYEAVRREPNQFLVVSGHVYEEIESVVRRTDSYAVIAKLGKAGQVAEELSPRHA